MAKKTKDEKKEVKGGFTVEQLRDYLDYLVTKGHGKDKVVSADGDTINLVFPEKGKVELW